MVGDTKLSEPEEEIMPEEVTEETSDIEEIEEYEELTKDFSLEEFDEFIRKTEVWLKILEGKARPSDILKVRPRLRAVKRQSKSKKQTTKSKKEKTKKSRAKKQSAKKSKK